MPWSRARPTKTKPAATNASRNTSRPPLRMPVIVRTRVNDLGMLWWLLSALVAAVLFGALAPALKSSPLVRTNYAGRCAPRRARRRLGRGVHARPGARRDARVGDAGRRRVQRAGGGDRPRRRAGVRELHGVARCRRRRGGRGQRRGRAR